MGPPNTFIMSRCALPLSWSISDVLLLLLLLLLPDAPFLALGSSLSVSLPICCSPRCASLLQGCGLCGTFLPSPPTGAAT